MGFIERAFTLAERYVDNHERYIDATLKRYEDMALHEERSVTASEQMLERVPSAPTLDLQPLVEQIAALSAMLADWNLGQLTSVVRSAIEPGPSGRADR